MTLTNELTLSLPRVPEEVLAPGVLYTLRGFIRREANFDSVGTAEAEVNMDVRWVDARFDSVGTASADMLPQLSLNAQFDGSGSATGVEKSIHHAYAQFDGVGTADAAVRITKVSFFDDYSAPEFSTTAYSPIQGSTQLPVVTAGKANIGTATSSDKIAGIMGSMPTVTDNCGVGMVIGALGTVETFMFVRGQQFGTGYALPEGGAGVAVTTGGVNGVPGKLQIYSIASSSAQTLQSELNNIVLAVGDVIELVAVGNFYEVWRNGARVGLSWTDPGGVVITGPGRRYCGFRMRTNFNAVSPSLDAFFYSDK